MHINNFKYLNNKVHLYHPQIDYIRKSAKKLFVHNTCEQIILTEKYNSTSIVLLNSPQNITKGINILLPMMKSLHSVNRAISEAINNSMKNCEILRKHLKEVHFLKDTGLIGFLGVGSKSVAFLTDSFKVLKITDSYIHSIPILIPELQAKEYGIRKTAKVFNILQEWGITDINDNEFNLLKTKLKEKANDISGFSISDILDPTQAARFLKEGSFEEVRFIDKECITTRKLVEKAAIEEKKDILKRI